MSEAAIITGGAKRIGRALALELAEMGYNIILHYNSSETDAKNTREEVIQLGVECEIFGCDLENSKASEELIHFSLKTFKNTSILVNNASIFENIALNDVSYESFDREFNINFRTPFFLCKTFTSKVSEGLIINMLDSRITKVHTRHFVYNLSKKALYHFTLTASKALAPNIRVNGICPGPVLPPPGEENDFLNSVVEKTPLKKFIVLEDIRSALNYLVSTKVVTGEVLFVDGGQHL